MRASLRRFNPALGFSTPPPKSITLSARFRTSPKALRLPPLWKPVFQPDMMAQATSQPPYTVPLPGGIPADHKPHTESRTTILLPSAGAFLNPPQQFNRDLSVAVIRAWNEKRKEIAEAKSRVKAERLSKKGKGKGRALPDEHAAEEVAKEGELYCTWITNTAQCSTRGYGQWRRSPHERSRTISACGYPF